MNWQIPQELPDLRRVGIVALDTETNDEGLRADRGSGWPWRGGRVAGISVAWRADGEMHAIYVPLRHPGTDNFDPDRVYLWLKDLVASGVRIVTLNGVYDWGWLRTDGGIVMPPSKHLEEVGALATIVDENQRRYSLDALCERYDLPGKDMTLLNEGIEALGFASGRQKIDAREYIWQMPARYVGPYAENDAIATLLLFEGLNPVLDQEGTRDAYRLEVDLMPVVMEMRCRGIRIDQDAAEKARDLLLGKRDTALTIALQPKSP
jgi:DNA polymerase I-like protein with 3'-5' exonuclease and polymerase domains